MKGELALFTLGSCVWLASCASKELTREKGLTLVKDYERSQTNSALVPHQKFVEVLERQNAYPATPDYAETLRKMEKAGWITLALSPCVDVKMQFGGSGSVQPDTPGPMLRVTNRNIGSR